MLADARPINHSFFPSLQVLAGIPGETHLVPDGWEMSTVKAAGAFILPAESFIFTNGATRLGGEGLKVPTILEVS